jgi:putative ABC transport system permease protein
VRVNRQTFRVIGVLEAKGGGTFGSQDNILLVPLTTYVSRLQSQRAVRGGRITVNQITVQAANPQQVELAKEEIAGVLRERHGYPQEDDFTIFSQQDIIQAVSQVTGVFTIFLGAIAGISLLVGGIGVMNIMLVSVVERTREIGIRKAVGARRKDILLQFLAEAVALSVGGGLVGVAAGWGASRAVSRISINGQNLPSHLSADIVALAVGVTIVIGLFFGIYPAFRAASMDPIEALRHE